MKMKKRVKIIVIVIAVLIILVIIGISAKSYFFNEKEKFEVDNLFLKVSIEEDGISSNNIKFFCFS